MRCCSWVCARRSSTPASMRTPRARCSGGCSRGELDLLYVAPERLVTEGFLAALERMQAGHGLALFAIDEAHCVSQWGHDFRPEYIQLSILQSAFPRCRGSR